MSRAEFAELARYRDDGMAALQVAMDRVKQGQDAAS